jgi:cell division protein FtsI/penicillin-binding protein 2
MIASSQQERSTDRRVKYLSVVIFLLSSLLIFRLFERGVMDTGNYRKMADRQYYTKIDQPAKRGEIYIKDNESTDLIDQTKAGLFPVASDLELFDLSVIPKNVLDKTDTAKKLASITGLEESEIFSKINNNKPYLPPLKKRMSKEEADKIVALNIKGVFLEGQYSRVYPEREFLSQVLGFVDFDGNGKYGLEGFYDGLLKGEGGKLMGVKDNFGKVVKVEQSEPGKTGADIVLTIDRSIQYMAEKKLKEGIDRYAAEGGSIIIMDPKTGGILAMTSLPNYDPNKFNEVKSDNQSVFLNPTVSSNWEPGSIFKPVVVAGAIQANLLQPDSKPSPEEGGFTNSLTIDGYEIHNALDKSYGFETVTQILENSDNIGMVWVANKQGNDVLSQFISKMGFNIKTGIDLSGESPGQVRSARTWKDINRATISFGQGISVTPIQIMQAYQTIANKGKLVKPHLLDRVIIDKEQNKYEPSEAVDVMSAETAKKVADMLVSVVENGHGKPARVEGYRVAGKTGTAQVPKSDGGYEENSFIGSFAGFAPEDNPRFVMLVKLNKPKNVEWAESSAAPIFGEIANWLLNDYMKVPK